MSRRSVHVGRCSRLSRSFARSLASTIRRRSRRRSRRLLVSHQHHRRRIRKLSWRTVDLRDVIKAPRDTKNFALCLSLLLVLSSDICDFPSNSFTKMSGLCCFYSSYGWWGREIIFFHLIIPTKYTITHKDRTICVKHKIKPEAHYKLCCYHVSQARNKGGYVDGAKFSAKKYEGIVTSRLRYTGV